MSGVRFNPWSTDEWCGATVKRRARECACTRISGHDGECIALMRDAADADGVLHCCREPVGEAHHEQCWRVPAKKEETPMTEPRAEDMPANTPEERIAKALAIAMQSGGVDGAHHKAWVIDQMVRALTPDYPAWVNQHNHPDGEDGDVYDWDEGIAP